MTLVRLSICLSHGVLSFMTGLTQRLRELRKTFSSKCSRPGVINMVEDPTRRRRSDSLFRA